MEALPFGRKNFIRARCSKGSTVLFIVCLTINAWPNLVSAQSTDINSIELAPVTVEEQANAYNPTTSSVATKTSTRLLDIPQTINIVPRSVIQDQAATSLQDVLQNVPGVGFSLGDGQRDQVTIRGFSAILDQYVDGVRDDAFYFRDLSSLERVEVLKGPASVLYGRGSAGGMINSVTKKPLAIPFEALSVTIGSEGKHRGEWDVAFNEPSNKIRFRMSGAIEDSTSFRQQFFLERQAVSPSIQFILGENTTLTLQGEYLHDKRLGDQGIPSYHGRPANVPIDTYYGSSDGRAQNYVEAAVGSGTATLDHLFTPDFWYHGVFRGYTYSLVRNNITFSRLKDGSDPTVSFNNGTRFRDDTGFITQQEFTWNLDLSVTHHQILFGAELLRQNKNDIIRNISNAVTYDLFHPRLILVPKVPLTLAPTSDNETVIEGVAAYVQDIITIVPQLKAVTGGRFDLMDVTITNNKVASTFQNSRTDKVFSPRAGLIYEPTDRLSFYLSFSRSFQPVADSLMIYRNIDELKPQETTSYEVGSKWTLTEKATLAASLFQMEQKHVLSTDPDDPTIAIEVGKQRSRGFELSLSGELLPKLSILTGYSYLNTEITQSTDKTLTGQPIQGNRTALAPRHSFNLWLKRELPYGFYATAGMNYQSSRFTSPTNQVELPSYVIFEAGAGYHCKYGEINLLVENLFDRKYYVSGHGNADNYNMPGAPRTVVVSYRTRF